MLFPLTPDDRANKIDPTIPWCIFFASVLPMLFKQYVNYVQIIEASKLLAEGDVAMRRKAGLPRRESKENI
jgi:CDP-diacylglycerol--inositol 3-phosphatidyltransferase